MVPFYQVLTTTKMSQFQESKGTEGDPAVGLPGAGSDHASFIFYAGVPVIDFSFDAVSWTISQRGTFFQTFSSQSKFCKALQVLHHTVRVYLATRWKQSQTRQLIMLQKVFCFCFKKFYSILSNGCNYVFIETNKQLSLTKIKRT